MSDRATQTPPPVPSPLPQSPATTVRKRRRRWVKILVAIVVLVLFGVAAAPTIIAKTALRNRIARQATADLNGTIDIGAASLGWFSPIELRDVTLNDLKGRSLLKVPKLTSSRTLLGLIRDRATPGEFTLEQPTLEVVCEPESTNLEEVLQRLLVDDGTARGPTRPALKIHVNGGTLKLLEAEKSTTGEFRDIDAMIAIPAVRSEPITAKFTANAPGRFTADMSVGESSRVKLTANGLTLESLAPLLRRFSVDLTLAGTITADLTASWGKDSAAVEGMVGGQTLSVSGSWLNGDILRVGAAQLPLKCSMTGRALRIDRADLTTDMGSISVAGSFDSSEPFEKLLERPGTRLEADVDLAKLARALPKSMRVRDCTEIREGKLLVRLESRSAPNGTEWIGKIDTSSLKALRDGKELRWEDPLAVEFSGRFRPGHLPTFDKLICRSDFIALQAEVKPDSIRAAANFYLDRLAARLADFVDLGGATLDGRGGATLVVLREPDGSFKADGSLDLKQFAFTGRSGKGLKESQVSLRFSGAGRAPDGGPIAVSTAPASLTAGQDELHLILVEPIADAKQLSSGRVDARLAGDLGRWWARVGSLVRLPKHYILGGTTTARGSVRFGPDSIAVDRLALKLVNARFRGAGLDLEEPQLDAVADVTIDTKAMSATFDKFTVNSAPLSVANGRLVVLVPEKGEVVVEGSGPAVVGLGRLGKTVKVFADPRGADSMHGRGTGLIRFRHSGDMTTFGGTLDIVNFSVGPPTAPDWTEPTLRLETDGSYVESTDTVALTVAKIERPGLAVGVAITLAKLGTIAELNLNGTVTYDLAKLTPKLREQLGGNFTAQGRGSTPVTLTGSLLPVAAPGSKTRPGALAAMNGEFRIPWESLRAYGFEMGRSELHATLASGVGRVSPIAATFGGGQVHVQPTVHLEVEDGYATLAKGKIVERARLTPAVCAEGLGYALPAMARSGKAEGEISLTVGENRIPFGDATKALVKGQITIHKATVSPSPVIGEIAKLLGAGSLAMTVANDTVVPMRVENGTVHHQNFTVQIGGHTVSTSGSVGFDGKLNLLADIPVPAALLKSSPLAAKALANRRVKVPITGTLTQPTLDPRQFQSSIAALAQEAMKDVGKELLNKELDKLFPGMPRPKK